MKRKLPALLAVLIVILFSSINQSYANYVMGGELTYTSISPNVYTVEFKMYRDCYAIPSIQSVNLNIRSGNCSPARNIVLNLVGNGVFTTAQPYCTSITQGCGGTSPQTYQPWIFRGTLSFNSTEAQCPDWTLSVTHDVRTAVTNVPNIVNSTWAPFHIEAYLRQTPGQYNSSASFPGNTLPYVNLNQISRFSSYAIDPDGDSLVYSLGTFLSAPGTSVPYNTYPTRVLYNYDSTKYVPIPAGTYSPAFPFSSHAVNWNQPMPLTPVKNFQFNTRTGELNFTPAFFTKGAYAATTSSALKDENKSFIKVNVDEYRKINGAMVKVGTVSREMVMIVFNTNNANPVVTNSLANGQPVADNDVIKLRPGTPLNLQFSATDLNAADMVEMQSDATTLLPGATLTVTSGNFPTGILNWTPNANHVQDQPYFIHVTLKDNACPVRGTYTQTFAIKVSATGGVTGQKEVRAAVNSFIAYPNPFTQEVAFKVNHAGKGGRIEIYNLLGQKVDQLFLNPATAGEQQIKWEQAGKFAAGTYVAKLVMAGNAVFALKFTRLQ